MLTIQEKGIYKVVDAGQLEVLTSNGWRLIAVLEQQSPMSFCDMETLPTVPTYSGGPSTMSVSNTRYHDMKGQMFLLVRDEESAIVALKAEAADLYEKNKELRETAAKTAEVRDATIKALTAAEATNKTLTEQNQKLAEKEAVANDALTKYKAEVTELVAKAKETSETAAAIIAENAQRRKTAYERVTEEGAYDDGVESVEERDVR